MKVFISWSGDRSGQLAGALHSWIPLILDYVEPWLSRADIDAGQRWADRLAKELETSDFGILIITAENIDAPWMLFEAGALAKSVEGSRVIPLLLGLELRDIAGPLAQFQAKKVERTGVFEVIQSLNRIREVPVPADRVESRFRALWPELETRIATIQELPHEAKRARPHSEILEELVTIVRSLDRASARTLATREEMYLEVLRLLRQAQWSVIDTTWGADAPQPAPEAADARDQYIAARSAAVERGVRYREVFSQTEGKAGRIAAAGELMQRTNGVYSARVVDISEKTTPIFDFGVVDGRHVVVSHVRRDHGHRFVYIDSPQLGSFLTDWFEDVWAGARK